MTKVLWLYVTRSNNQPDNIAKFYLDAVEEFGGCPVDLVTDLGTENGTMAAIQAFFRDDPNSHRYVPSPRNQRIEAWWGLLRKSCTTWWINFFKDLVAQRTIDLASELDMECLWFCFAELIQKVLNEIKEHWNTHYIRKSRHDTVSGRPDSLYYLPTVMVAATILLCQFPRLKFIMLVHMLSICRMTTFTKIISIMLCKLVIITNQPIGERLLNFTMFSSNVHVTGSIERHHVQTIAHRHRLSNTI